MSRRNALWARARALDLADDPTLSARARRLAQRGAGAPLTVDDLLAAPDWVTWDDGRRERLAMLAGAAAVAPAWRRCVDGALLRRAAGAVGEGALDALLSSPSPRAAVSDPAAEAADPEALARLGRAALASEAATRPALMERVSRLLGARPWREAAPAAVEARALMAQLGEAP